MTISPIQTNIKWSTEYVDIPGLTNYTSTPSDTQASCTNTDVITSYGNSSTYPAAWAAKNYNPSGTPSGKTWCLPSGGLLNNALNNSTNFAKINAGINTGGGIKLGYGGQPSDSYENVLSSSENSGYNAWNFTAKTSALFYMSYNLKYYGGDNGSIRPVLAF